MYLISILILSSCQVADVQNGTEKKDNFLQEVGRLSDFVLSQSKVGGYLSEEDAVILDNWLKELSTRYDFQNNLIIVEIFILVLIMNQIFMII